MSVSSTGAPRAPLAATILHPRDCRTHRQGHAAVLACLPLTAVVLGVCAAVQTAGYAVYHDELWNHPAAVSLLAGKSWREGYEVKVFGLPLPVVSGPYQGSLKTYLLAPWLAVLGTSPAALRGIHCALGLGYLCALYWALRTVLSRRAAALVFLLPLVDPNLTMSVPTDQGPFLLQNTLLAISLGASLRLAQRRELRWVLLALGSASLALADKLTGLPMAAALFALGMGLGVGVLGRQLKRWVLAGVVAIAPLLPHAAYFAVTGLTELEANVGAGMGGRNPYPTRLRQTVTEFSGDLAGGAVISRSLAGEQPPPHRPLLTPLALALAGLGGMAALLRRPRAAEAGLASLCLALGVVVYAAVPGLTRPWHYLQLHPPLVVAAIAGFAALTRLPSPGRRWSQARRGAAALLLVAAAAWEAQRTLELLRFLAERQGAHMYSPGLYALHREVAGRRPQRLVCLNYSLCNPLYVLLAGRVEVVDLTWAELSTGTEEYVRNLLSVPGTVMVYRQVAAAAGPRQQEYFDWLNRTSDWLLPRLEHDQALRRAAVTSSGDVEFGLVLPSE